METSSATSSLPDAAALALPVGLTRTRFAAMGTTVEVLLPERESAAGTACVRALFAAWERTLSRFLPESELSALNRQTGAWVSVSELLFSVLATVLDAARATDGLYDPTLLRQMLLVGYDRSIELLDAAQAPLAAPTVPPRGGWRGIQLDAERRRVLLPRGVGLDFGGIAKGMAVDAALTELHARGIAPALVNAGGDLAVRGAPAEAGDWSVSVPGRAGNWVIALRQGALATSGIARRSWRQGERQRHHLLDPRTGEPATSGLWSVTVAAATCAQAEVAAKVAFVLGAGRGARFLEEYGLAGVLVAADGAWSTAGAWPAMTAGGGT